MNTLHRIIFFCLLNIANLAFSMESSSTPTTPTALAAQFPSPPSIMPATIYFETDNGYKTLKDLQNSSSSPKTFSKNGERHGCCHVWRVENEWFAQRIDPIRKIFIGKAQQIQKPGISESSLLLTQSSHLKTVIQIGNENYLLHGNKPGYRLTVIPYEKINAVTNFFIAQKEEENLLQILPDNATTISDNKKPEDAKTVGLMRGFLNGRMLVDIIKNQNIIKTISLPIDSNVYCYVAHRIKEAAVYANSPGDEKNIFQLQETTTEEIATNNAVKQISHIPYDPEINKPHAECVIHEAKAKNISHEKEDRYCKITFSIADTKYTRFLSLKKTWDDDLYAKINDIKQGEYVHFKRPTNGIQHKDLIHYISKQKKSKIEKQESEATLSEIIKNKLGCTTDEMSTSSFAVVSNEEAKNLFRPTYTGSLSKIPGNSFDVLLKINDIKDNVITLQGCAHKLDISSPKNIALQDKTGDTFMVVTCTPAAKKSSTPIPIKSIFTKAWSYKYYIGATVTIGGLFALYLYNKLVKA